MSLSVWATRLVLGYLRMDDRYKSIVAQLLAGKLQHTSSEAAVAAMYQGLACAWAWLTL